MKTSDYIPQHIAFILDGNRRWAKERGLPSLEGHRKAFKILNKIISAVDEMGIRYMTIYAFSSENWNRSAKEISGLMSLLEYYINVKSKELFEKNIRIKVVGNLSKLSSKLLKMITDIVEKSNNNSGMTLVIALSYSGREEMINATKQIAMQHKKGLCILDEIDEDFFKKFLYVNIPDPDLLIRTGGNLRISNFLLWQIAYTELYFIEKYWPDFTPEDLKKAILEFQNRERRYGR